MRRRRHDIAQPAVQFKNAVLQHNRWIIVLIHFFWIRPGLHTLCTSVSLSRASSRAWWAGRSACGYWMVHPPSAMYTAPWRSPPPRGHRVSGSEKEYARSSGSISLRTEGEVSVAISAAAVTSLARVPVTASRCRGNRRPSCGHSPRSDRGRSRSARVVIRRILRYVLRCATGCFVSRTGRRIGT